MTIGFCAIVFGVVFFFEPAMYFFFLGLIIAAPAGYVWLKNKVTVPRIGMVRFKPERAARINSLRLIIIAIVVIVQIVTAAIWILSSMKALPASLSEFLDQYYMVYFGIILAAILAIGAYLADLRRFYGYSIVVLATFVGLHFLDVPGKLGLGLTIAGLVILLSGLVMLLKFMREFPVVPVVETGNTDINGNS